jgi:hypothetical protein
MSLIITMFVREGMVMASDSRLTLNSQQGQVGASVIQQLAVSQSDTNNKTFLAPNDIGISTCGAADVNGVPIGGFIESFIREKLQNITPAIEVDQVPTLLLNYFRALSSIPATIFHVAGYKKEGEQVIQHVYTINVSAAAITRVNLLGVLGENGAAWNGEIDILTRLINPVFTQQGSNFTPLPTYPIPFQFFTLQDAIDFSVYAIAATIDSMRFMPRAKTVGGPIDVLVIRPQGAEWIQKKRLHII